MPNMFYKPKTKKIGNVRSTKVNCWKSPSTIQRANSKLGRLCRTGKAIPLVADKEKIRVAVPQENAIYQINLDKKGFIKNIKRF